jgi:hypothetical protein
MIEENEKLKPLKNAKGDKKKSARKIYARIAGVAIICKMIHDVSSKS